MRAFLILFFTIWTTVSGFSQLLTLSQLEYLASQDDWQVINNYLLKKGWTFITADSTRIVWAYNPTKTAITFSDDPVEQWEANAWFSISFNRWNEIEDFGYQFSGEIEHYNTLLNSLKAKGYVKERQFTSNGALNFIYKNNKYEIILGQKLGESDYYFYLRSPNQLFFVLIKRR